MKELFLCVIFLFIPLIQSQGDGGSLTCTYLGGYLQGPYYCILEIDNPDNRDDFESIGGVHPYPGYNDTRISTVFAVPAREGTAKSLPSVICKQFDNLRQLYFDNLGIEFITDKSLSDCHNLESLYLGHNNLREISANVFGSNLNLKVLDLGWNELTTIPSGTLDHLEQLVELFIDNNHFSTISANWFVNLKGLEVLNVNGNELWAFPTAMLANQVNLRTLRASGNKLERLTGNILPAAATNLTRIEIENNRISFIDPDVFVKAPNLQMITAEGNLCVNEDVDVSLRGNEPFSICFRTELTCTYTKGDWLDISYSCLLDVNNPGGRDDFTTVGGSHITDYQDDRVTAIYGAPSREDSSQNVPQIICNKFPKVLVYYFDGMGVEVVTENSFRACRDLKSLYLGDNRISNIHEGAFATNTKLELLDLGMNQLTALPNFPLNLHHLYVDHNLIEIHQNSLSGLNKLETLWMASCGVEELKSEWFTGLTALKELYLGDNNIAVLPVNAFAGLINLEVLKLNHNKLTSLVVSSFPSTMTHLVEFYANSNEISSIDPEIFAKAANLKVLHFEHNSCINENFNDFFGNRADNYQKFDSCFRKFFEGTTTDAPSTTTGGSSSQWMNFVKILPLMIALVSGVIFRNL